MKKHSESLANVTPTHSHLMRWVSFVSTHGIAVPKFPQGLLYAKFSRPLFLGTCLHKLPMHKNGT